MVIAPVCGHLYKASRSSLVVAQGFAEFSRGGSKANPLRSDVSMTFERDYGRHTATVVTVFDSDRIEMVGVYCRTENKRRD